MQRFVKINYILVLFLGIMLPMTLSAQKEVRKNVRKGNKEYQQQKYADASDLYGKALKENPACRCGPTSTRPSPRRPDIPRSDEPSVRTWRAACGRSPAGP